jgi:hypothetical protein
MIMVMRRAVRNRMEELPALRLGTCITLDYRGEEYGTTKSQVIT